MGVASRAWLSFVSLVGCREPEPTAPEREPAAPRQPATPDRIEISPAAAQRAGISTQKAETTPLSGGVEVPAEIGLDPDRVVHIAPLVSGQIVDVKVSVGEQVEREAVLATMRSVELGEVRSSLSRARANVEVARTNFERQEQLRNEGIGSQRAYLEAQAELERAKAELTSIRRTLDVYGRGGSGSTTPIRSPMAGEVVARHATVGEVVQSEDVLFTVADPDPVWVMGHVYPQDLDAAKEGSPVTLSIPDLPGRVWEGRLDWVSPVLDENTRTLPVRVVLPNENGELRPGLFGTLRIPEVEAEATPVVTVPEDAVQTLDGRTVLFVPGERDGVFEVRAVALGRRARGRVEVVEGLRPQEPYVASGAFILKSQLLRDDFGEGHGH